MSRGIRAISGPPRSPGHSILGMSTSNWEWFPVRWFPVRTPPAAEDGCHRCFTSTWGHEVQVIAYTGVSQIIKNINPFFLSQEWNSSSVEVSLRVIHFKHSFLLVFLIAAHRFENPRWISLKIWMKHEINLKKNFKKSFHVLFYILMESWSEGKTVEVRGVHKQREVRIVKQSVRSSSECIKFIFLKIRH